MDLQQEFLTRRVDTQSILPGGWVGGWANKKEGSYWWASSQNGHILVVLLDHSLLYIYII